MKEKDLAIIKLLDNYLSLVNQGDMEKAYQELSTFVDGHTEYIDERFREEMKLLLQIAEYKRERKEYAFQLSIDEAYHYCEKKYSSAGCNLDSIPEEVTFSDRDTVWVCWLQGIDSAPQVVRVCFETIHKLGKKIQLISENNFQQYVLLPDYVMEKYAKGIISRAHFSDLIRLELLTKKGGIWIDATTFVSGTDQIIPILNDEELFLYRSGQVSRYIIFDNWFIYAGKMSKILEATRRMLLEYWQYEEKAIHYYIMHLFMTIACRLYPEEYQSIPLYSNEPCHVLQYSLSKQFQEKRWKQIKGMSNIHKLTYKIETPQIENSFYELICNGDLNRESW